MAGLRALFESMGHTDVATYIQSGNVVFTAAKAVTPVSLERAIAAEFGIEPAVVLRTPKELAAAIRANPFPRADPTRLHVGFMANAPAAATLAKIDAEPFRPEEFAVRGHDLYLHLPDGMGRAKLPPFLDRRLRIPTTVRNWNTVNKLLELSAPS